MSRLQRNIAATLCALSLFSLTTPALADSGKKDRALQAGKQMQSFRMQMPGGGMRFGMMLRDQAAELTEEQRAALEQAQTAQEEAYKAFLAELVTAGIVTQAELDAYNRIAAQRKIAGDIDTMQWTLEKNMTLREALAKSGKEKQDALAAFVTEELLTQEQADALLASTTTERSINYDAWTVAQLKEFQTALRGSTQERNAAIEGAVTSGLLTQTEADALLSAQTGMAGRFAGKQLTEEQQTAWKTAAEAYQAACERAQEPLKEAGVNGRGGKMNKK